MSEITPFQFGTHPVRVVTIDGEPWWVAADVCSVLGIIDVRDAVNRLYSDDRVQTPVVDSAGRINPNTWAINESGMYELVIRSDKPNAREFRRWITSEVLPEIRRTGSYSVVPLQPLDDLDMVEVAIRNIREQRARVAAVEQRQSAVEIRQDAVEAKVSAVAGEHGWFTSLAYAKLNRLSTDRVSCQKHGQRASRLMRDQGLEPRKRQDSSFGTINTYPVWALDETR